MGPADPSRRSEDRTVLRAVAAGLAVAFVVALGLPWTSPPYSKAPFSGYAMFVVVLLLVALGVTRLRCRVATALTVLVVLGLVAELLWMGQAASNASSHDTVVLGGMLVTLFLSFVAFVVTIRLADLVQIGPPG